MATDSTGVRLGDLLTGANLLKPEELREAMQIAKHQSLPVGRVLIMSGYLSESQLKASVQAQSMLKDGLVDFDTVIKALGMVASDDLTLDDAFRSLGWEQKQAIPTNKLGEILLESGIVGRAQLDAALTQCANSGLPLGRVLVITGVTSEAMLAAALNAQVLVRDKKVTREQAVQGLKATKERQIPLEQSLAETGLQLPTKATIRLGELLLMGGLLSEASLMDYVEIGLVNEQPIGQVLLSQGIIDQRTLDTALAVQKRVADGSILGAEAPQILAKACKENVSIDEAIARIQPPPEPPKVEVLPLYQFLQLAGMITPKDLNEAVRVGTMDTEIMGRMLLMASKIDENMLNAACRCLDYMGASILNHEQAIMTMNHCQRNGGTVEEAFTSLGWSITADAVSSVALGQPLMAPAAPSALPAPPPPLPVQAAQVRNAPSAPPLPGATPPPLPGVAPSPSTSGSMPAFQTPATPSTSGSMPAMQAPPTISSSGMPAFQPPATPSTSGSMPAVQAPPTTSSSGMPAFQPPATPSTSGSMPAMQAPPTTSSSGIPAFQAPRRPTTSGTQVTPGSSGSGMPAQPGAQNAAGSGWPGQPPTQSFEQQSQSGQQHNPWGTPDAGSSASADSAGPPPWGTFDQQSESGQQTPLWGSPPANFDQFQSGAQQPLPQQQQAWSPQPPPESSGFMPAPPPGWSPLPSSSAPAPAPQQQAAEEEDDDLFGGDDPNKKDKPKKRLIDLVP